LTTVVSTAVEPYVRSVNVTAQRGVLGENLGEIRGLVWVVVVKDDMAEKQMLGLRTEGSADECAAA
jgi:hypothetical protein